MPTPDPKRTAAKRKRTARKAAAQTEQRRVRHKRLLIEAHAEAGQAAQGVRLDADPADAVQEILDNLVAMYRYATGKVLTLEEEEYWRETMTGKIPNEWIREQERLSMQITHVAAKAVSMGVAERQIKLEEAKAMMFAQVVDLVLHELGLSHDQRLEAHEKIATRLMDIEGVARDSAVKRLAA